MLIISIFKVIFPIVFIVTIGYLYARFHPVNLSTMSHLSITIFSPALLLSVFTDQAFHILDYQQLILATILILLGSGLIIWPLIWWFGINPKTILPSMMFVNAGNMGISVALFAFGEKGLPAALIFFMIASVLNFTLGIYMLNRTATWLNLAKLPIVQATMIGLLMSITGVKIPELLLTPIKMLGMCAIPVMLLLLGARLVDLDFTHWKIGLLGALLRPVSGTLMYLFIRPWFTLTPIQSSGLLIFAVLPPAIINCIIAEQYQQEPRQVAAIVMLGNLMSLVSLPIALAFALPGV